VKAFAPVASCRRPCKCLRTSGCSLLGLSSGQTELRTRFFQGPARRARQKSKAKSGPGPATDEQPKLHPQGHYRTKGIAGSSLQTRFLWGVRRMVLLLLRGEREREDGRGCEALRFLRAQVADGTDRHESKHGLKSRHRPASLSFARTPATEWHSAI
jgi:hypothetical protein